ncbi:hypothetical protein PAXRUDRAFT_831207 [Paxillus rubicundulus Ve08.2h10]|uniref:Uncharacterized protein n=1 Tax=Paxillus rubicundulus Ve08.2h10 TaxID=930991 RepID=A0A0D0DSE3_9AGAM|nr:hypothetical protein PAXRUDRAFT_831207 [Paxillus rubicundulus Ve08.2h10]
MGPERTASIVHARRGCNRVHHESESHGLVSPSYHRTPGRHVYASIHDWRTVVSEMHSTRKIQFVEYPR